MRIAREKMKSASTDMGLGLHALYRDSGLMMARGRFIIEMVDAESGEVLRHFEKDNVITLDGGILAARLFKDSLDPNSGQSNGLTMLAVGTGATGAPLAPDAPSTGQRKLNNEIARKTFASVTFRDSNGAAVAYPTNIVDFTTTFGESEAVGTLNEMGLLSTFSLNPAVTNPINNGPSDYDATIDVTGSDLLANYLTFSVITKPATAILSITWRLSF